MYGLRLGIYFLQHKGVVRAVEKIDILIFIIMSFTRYNPSQRILSPAGRKYHVFLSFRGGDIRKTFVDHLFASLKNAEVNTFLDSEMLNRGDEIGSTIIKAIEDSAILIPIFSKNYAESYWCLEEVSRMCKSGGLIIPLFYDVSPTEVRYPDRGAFAKAFQHKKARYTKAKIDEWKKSLTKVASFSGWSKDDTFGFEAGLVKLVVQDVFKTLQNVIPEEDGPANPLDEADEIPLEAIPLEIRNEPLRISKSVFGMEERMDKVINLLKIDSEDNLITVAICGMAGVGKTSLARAVHNHIYHKFEAACFVYDVRHKAQHTNGIAKMQRQILKDLVKFKDKVNDEAHGKSLMSDQLRSIKALVILEYVGDSKQLEALRGDWYGPGSRVLVITLDSQLLIDGQVDFVYEMQGLDRDHALQPFSWHAFMRDKPDEVYEELSRRAVNICNGLPFLLEVLGAHLYNKNISYWVEACKLLENLVHHDKYAILRLCYDALNFEQKEMFLDMACLFIGRKRESVISFWEASHCDPNKGLMDMILKSLISLDEDDRFAMHSKLRDMGRARVAEESEEPGERSRLWKLQEAELVVMEGKGTQKVRCLTYLQQEVTLQTNNLQKMSNLQFLWLDGASIEGDFAQMPPEMKWLRWENCPLKCLPCEWNMKHLAVLDLSFSKDIEVVWAPFSDEEGPKNLKVLKLNYCKNLRVLPDLSNHASLIRLELCGCTELKELPKSVGFLRKLKHLDLSNCYNLTHLPDTITNLSSLEVFFLSNCHNIRRLPDSFGDLTVLKKIRLNGMPLKELPQTFRWLSCLEKLTLHGCRELRSLPLSIGELNCLRYLDIHGCSSLRALPDSIYELKNLCHLDMTDCQRIDLREQLGNLVCMERLILSNCPTIRSLSTSIGRLNCLRHLNMSNCDSLFRLPDEIGNLVCLEDLLLNKCYNLCELPQSIGNLSKLKHLEMEENYSLSSLPPSFSRLSSLKHLKSGGCGLPQNIGKFSSLEVLYLKSYKISFLPGSFSRLPRLNKLYLRHCTELIELPALPKNLLQLCIQDCLGLRKISSLSHMKKLKLLRIHNCRELVVLPDLASLQALQDLSISKCRNVKRIAGVEGLKSLRKLQVAGCSTSVLIPLQLIKETICLELFSFCANRVPESLQHKMQASGDDLLNVKLEINELCTGVILCFMIRFNNCITSVNIETSILRDGKEIFNTKLPNHSKDAVGDRVFVHILRKNHPLVMMLQSGDVVHAKAEGDEERKLIRSGGLQLFYKGEDGRTEDLILRRLGIDITLLMETYKEDEDDN